MCLVIYNQWYYARMSPNLALINMVFGFIPKTFWEKGHADLNHSSNNTAVISMQDNFTKLLHGVWLSPSLIRINYEIGFFNCLDEVYDSVLGLIVILTELCWLVPMLNTVVQNQSMMYRVTLIKKKHNTSATAYNFCSARSFQFKYLWAYFKDVLQTSTKFPWNRYTGITCT